MERSIEAKRRWDPRSIVQADLIEQRAPHFPLICYGPLPNQGLLMRCDGLKSSSKLVEFDPNVCRTGWLRRRHVDGQRRPEQDRFPICWICPLCRTSCLGWVLRSDGATAIAVCLRCSFKCPCR